MKPLSELNPATAHLWDIGDRWTEELFERHAWLLRAGEELRTTREAGCANNAPAHIR